MADIWYNVRTKEKGGKNRTIGDMYLKGQVESNTFNSNPMFLELSLLPKY